MTQGHPGMEPCSWIPESLPTCPFLEHSGPALHPAVFQGLLPCPSSPPCAVPLAPVLHPPRQPDDRCPASLPRCLPAVSCPTPPGRGGLPACPFIGSLRNPPPSPLQRLTFASCCPHLVCPSPNRAGLNTHPPRPECISRQRLTAESAAASLSPNP